MDAAVRQAEERYAEDIRTLLEFSLGQAGGYEVKCCDGGAAASVRVVCLPRQRGGGASRTTRTTQRQWRCCRCECDRTGACVGRAASTPSNGETMHILPFRRGQDATGSLTNTKRERPRRPCVRWCDERQIHFSIFSF